MKTLMTLIACTALAIPAMADTRDFRSIIGTAANIQRDAEMLRKDLKAKLLDEVKVKADIAALGEDIASLRSAVASLEQTAAAGSMSEATKKDWQMLKTKVELLTVFHERKSELFSSGDYKKNRTMLRAHAEAIAKRAELLQQTANRLDR
jgi:hypothetical protein